MPSITVVTREGDEHIVEVSSGESLMTNLKQAGFEEVVAICGGCVSCATCHVYVDFPSGEFLPPDEDELGLLDMSLHKQANSRLSCQVMVDDSLDGARVTIADED